MASEVIEQLNLRPGLLVVDCTLGRGGHAAMISQRITPNGKLIGIDRDADAVKYCSERLADEIGAGSVELHHAPFSRFRAIVGDRRPDRVLADLGVSSPQLDRPERGFSFMQDGPLDMRMDASSGISAADVINNTDESELADIFFRYGEEPKSRHFARVICARRDTEPFKTTLELADFIKAKNPYKAPSKKHPATKIFQALRIYVNGELEELELLLDAGFESLAPGGRMAFITFHSLEDRIVKHKLQEYAGKRGEGGAPTAYEASPKPPAMGRILKPFPIVPSQQECNRNTRARSAKLRVFEKNGEK